MSKILIIDTDREVLSGVSEALQSAGYKVLISDNSQRAINLAKEELPDLILLELKMPQLDGIDICLELNKFDKLKKTIFVFHSSDKEDFAQISAFDAGADDYIIKPVKTRVLVTRIKALLKRHKILEEVPAIVNEKGLKIDRDRYLVVRDGEEVILPRKEFELLSLLITNPHKAFTRNEIALSVWHKELDDGNRTIDVHIRHLRKKLGDKYIRTIKGFGYSLEL